MDLRLYDARVKLLMHRCGAIHVRGHLGKDADIDFYVNPNDAKGVISTLSDEGFFEAGSSPSKMKFYKVLGVCVFKIDVAYDFDYIFRRVSGIRFKHDFIERYLSDPERHALTFNAIRYLFLERKNPKYLNYLKQHRDAIIDNNSFFEPLHSSPFSRSLTTEKILAGIEKANAISIFPYLNLGRKSFYIKQRASDVFSILGRGRSVAVIGPDGCGKTTVIGALNEFPRVRSVYMGSNKFIFECLYAGISKESLVVFRAWKFFMTWFENWVKVGKVWLHKLMGRTVYLDRYPAYQYFQQPKKFRWLYHLAYGRLFPKPNLTIVLFCPEDVIRTRKKELSSGEIRAIYESFRLHIGCSRCVVWVTNEDLNETVKEIVKISSNHAAR